MTRAGTKHAARALDPEAIERHEAGAALAQLLRHRSGASTINGAVGRNWPSIGAGALDALSSELILLSHYCGVTPEDDAPETIQRLEEVLLRMSERAYAAAELAAAELAVARERDEGKPASGVFEAGRRA